MGGLALTHDERMAAATVFIGVTMNTWDGRRDDVWVLDRLEEYRSGQPSEYAQALSDQRIRRRDPSWGMEIA